MQKLIEQVAAHFNTNLSEIKVEPILHGTLHKPNVYRLRIGTDSFLLKKHDITVSVTETGFTPFHIERYTISTLNDGGLRVPRMIWESEVHNALLLEWCGDQTLDTIAQSNSVANLTSTLNTILLQLCRFESFFAENRIQFQPYHFHFNHKKTLELLLERGRKTIGYIQHLSKTPHSTSHKKRLDAAWTIFANRLLEATPTLGSLDYQAHNIVIDEDISTFIDFTSIGWDWQERRLVQYYNSIGANQEGANFVSLLNRELVETYAEWVVQNREKTNVTNVAARVDGHHLLLYLTVVHRILEAVARPEESENQTLMQAWGDMRLRFQHAISLIVNTDLSDDEYTNLIREMIGEFQATVS